MPFFGVPIRNGLPIGLGSVAGFGAPQEFTPAELFIGGTAGTWYDPSDLTTMFTTSAGTTPVAMPGQGSAVSVGLMLDKSQGLVPGPELASGTWANGTSFPFDTFTASGSGFSGTKAAFGFSQAALPTAISVTAGKIYRVTAVVAQATDDVITVGLQNSSGGGGLALATSFTFGTVTSSTTVVGYLRATSTGTAYLQFTNFGTAVTLTVTSTSLRELPGNHAISINDSTARPELRARVNLLTYSEEFENGAWTKGGVTVTQNAAVAPNGTTTADTLFETAITGLHRVRQTITLTAGQSVTLSFYTKAAGRNFVAISTSDFSAVFDISSGTVVSASGATASCADAGNGWFKCSITGSVVTTSNTIQAAILFDATTSSYTGDVTKGLIIWGADLRPANIGAAVPAYQRIADADTYDTAGFPLYLRFDGIDDGMYTPANLNLSGTDKVSVFAGVRKFNNTTQQFIVETSTNGFVNNGAFSLLTNTNSGGGTVAGAYGGTFRGTSGAGYGATGTTAPISNVVTAIGNIAAATDASILRVNGTQVATSGATSAGTGNFGTYPMYIASRQGVAPNLLEGHLHSLIVVGSAVSAGNISATEQWVANKTGIVIP